MVEASRAEFYNNPKSPELPDSLNHPEFIQGGMGVGVSDWKLARAVAIAGEKLGHSVMGVVSGTGLPAMMVHRLQDNDQDTIRALNAFDPEYAQQLTREYPPIGPMQEYKLAPKPEVLVNGRTQAIKDKMNKLSIAAAFVEVMLAKEGHNGQIGINLLEKVQLMQLSTLLGAMMAGVDTVLEGAGIPNQVPKVLENFSNNEEASYLLDLVGSREKIEMKLDPKKHNKAGNKLKKPKFYAIISHHALAMRLNSTVEVDGFVIEGPEAGGHNAPARGKQVDEEGEPIYGERDECDLEEMKKLGKPFWLAGSYAGNLSGAQELSARGTQVGSVFALCSESGLKPDIKDELLAKIRDESLEIKTSTTASPSGFPFQVVQLKGTLSEEEVRKARAGACTLGGLVKLKRKKNGGIVGLCPAEGNSYIKKGGDPKDMEGVVCACNGLASAAGYGQKKEAKFIILTLGKGKKSLDEIKELSDKNTDGCYSAEQVVDLEFAKAARRLEPGVSVDINPAPVSLVEDDKNMR